MGARRPHPQAEGAKPGLGQIVEIAGQGLFWTIVAMGVLTPIVLGLYGTMFH